MHSTRLTRALRMLTVLRSEQFVNADALSRSLNCSKRTVFRDLRLLNSSGIKISFDEANGGYVVGDGHQLPNHGLADGEILSLLLAARLSPLADVPHFAELLQRAHTFLLEHGGPELNKDFQRFQQAMTYDHDILECGAGQRLRTLIRTTARQGMLELNYLPESDLEHRMIRFQPQQVVHSSGGWTIVGYSVTDHREMELRLSQVSRVRDLEEGFEIPARSVQAESVPAKQTVHRIDNKSHDVPQPCLQIHRATESERN